MSDFPWSKMTEVVPMGTECLVDTTELQAQLAQIGNDHAALLKSYEEKDKQKNTEIAHWKNKTQELEPKAHELQQKIEELHRKNQELEQKNQELQRQNLELEQKTEELAKHKSQEIELQTRELEKKAQDMQRKQEEISKISAVEIDEKNSQLIQLTERLVLAEKAVLTKTNEVDNLKKISAATFTDMENKLLHMEKQNSRNTELSYQILLYFVVGKRLGLSGPDLEKRVLGSVLLFLQQRKKVFDYLQQNSHRDLAEMLKPMLLINESTLRNLIDRNKIA